MAKILGILCREVWASIPQTKILKISRICKDFAKEEREEIVSTKLKEIFAKKESLREEDLCF